MSETKRDYEIGYGKTPCGRPFQNGQSGNPRGSRSKSLPALPVAALDEKVRVTIDGSAARSPSMRRIVTQLVNKWTTADLRATKMLIDMLKEVEKKADAAAPREPARLSPADREVVEQFIARLHRQIAAEAEAAAEPPR